MSVSSIGIFYFDVEKQNKKIKYINKVKPLPDLMSANIALKKPQATIRQMV